MTETLNTIKTECIKKLPAGTFLKRSINAKKIYVIGILTHWKYAKSNNKPHYTMCTNVNDINDTIDINNNKQVYIGFDY